MFSRDNPPSAERVDSGMLAKKIGGTDGSSLVMTLIGAAIMAAALLVGCSDNDAKPVSSKQVSRACARQIAPMA